MSGSFHLANMGRLSGGDVKEDVDLLVSGIGSAFGSNAGAVVAVLLHELPDVLQGAVEFIAEYKVRRVGTWQH